jgi:hypothetical protein
VHDARLSVPCATEPWQIHHVRPDGSFALHAEPDADTCMLAIEAERFAPHPRVRFEPGARDLVITLADGAGLAGSVLVPAGFPPQALRALVRFSGSTRTAQVGSDGRFALAGIAEELVAVEIQLLPGEFVVARVADVAARLDAAEHDARLAAIDLRDAVRMLRLGVLLADGTPARGGWARDLRAADSYGQTAFVIEGGAVELLLPAGPADVELCVPGQRLLRVDGVDADRTVVLEPAFEVRCELPADVPLPPGGGLQLTLMPLAWESVQNVSLWRGFETAGWWSPAFGDESTTFDERRELRVPIQQTGTHAVRFHVVTGKPDGGRMSFEIPARDGLQRIELDERSAGETVRVAPDAARYSERLGGG